MHVPGGAPKMPDPWRQSALVVVARIGVVLALLAALLAPSRPALPGRVNAIVLMAAADQAGIAGARLAAEIGPSATTTMTPAVDDMHAAIREALWGLDRGVQNAIVAISDGHWDPELATTLRQADAAGLPVFWLPLQPEAAAPAVVRVRAPQLARAGQGISVVVEVRISGPADVVLLGNDRPLAQSQALQSGPVYFQVQVPTGGPLVIGAEISNAGTPETIARMERAALVNVATAPAILVAANSTSLFAESLRRGGWSVTELSSRELGGRIDTLPAFAGLVLDNISVNDLPAAAWSGIASAVRRDGMGLLVLGGPDAFGLGGYRGSQLESLLPVISEPPDDESPASLVFLIDVSGSMDRAGATGRRLPIAQQAVIAAATSLRPADRVGLITFDVEASVLLAAASRTDHVASIAQVWPDRASGGTRLLPALRLAVDELQRQDSEQKLLVLLTDGFLAGEDVGQIGAVLRGTDIELIGLVIDDGNQPGLGVLSAVAESGRSRIVRIDDVLRLPTLMRSELEASRPAVVTGRTVPVAKLPSTLFQGEIAWPAVSAYSLTRARPEARVHLNSSRGDALVASGHADAGRVVAMTSGFSGWTERWLQWPQWPEIAASLTNFIAARSAGDLAISVRQSPGMRARLTIDLADRDFPAANPPATVSGPAGTVNALELRRHSPGQFAADLRLDAFGQYAVTVADRGANSRYRFVHHPQQALPLAGQPIARDWLDDGLLREWYPGALDTLNDTSQWRILLLGLAACAFVLLLGVERLGSNWQEYLLPRRLRAAGVMRKRSQA